VFEARRLIEPVLVRRLIARRDPDAVAALRAIVVEEEAVRRPSLEPSFRPSPRG
jgi:DNA-binding GntR family transcriptional regulator